MHLLREIETRAWLLAVESEAQVKSEGDFSSTSLGRENKSNIIDRTANIITKMDNHISTTRNMSLEKHDAKENNLAYSRNQSSDASSSNSTVGSTKAKRRAKGFVPSRRQIVDLVDKSTDPEDSFSPLNQDVSSAVELSFPKWEERIGPAELERAVLSLLEFGQITAAKQLQKKLSPAHTPPEFKLVDAALKLATLSTPSSEIPVPMLDEDVRSVILSYKIPIDQHLICPLQVILLIS